MGASQSNNHTTYTKTDYQKMIHMYNLQNEVCKEDLIRILACCDKKMVNNIWNHTIGSVYHCTESQFDEIVEECRFRTSQRWLTYLLTISGINIRASVDQILTIIDWISFSCKELHSIITNSFPGWNTNDVDVSEFLTWIDRNLPEFGIDLARYMHRTLTGQLIFSGNINTEIISVVKNLQSVLMTPQVMILLCASLPMSYKTSEKVEEFVFMNVNRWLMLYSSDTHGISVSKLKEKSFDYTGNLILLVKCDSGLFCLVSDVGLKEDWNAYGGVDARFLQLEPIFKKYISGSLPVDTKSKSGIIYSHFTAKSGRRGILVGHNPLSNAVMEMDEDLTNIKVLGQSQAIRAIEVFAVGSGVEEKIAKLKDVRKWEDKEVNKHKNRKLKVEDWADNPDREILGMGGVNVRNADLVGGIDRDLEQRG